MESLNNIDPFREGRPALSGKVRKYLAWQRRQQEKEQLLQQIREFQLIGEFDWAKQLMVQHSINFEEGFNMIDF